MLCNFFAATKRKLLNTSMIAISNESFTKTHFVIFFTNYFSTPLGVMLFKDTIAHKIKIINQKYLFCVNTSKLYGFSTFLVYNIIYFIYYFSFMFKLCFVIKVKEQKRVINNIVGCQNVINF